MNAFEPTRFLRQVLLADAILAGGAGVLMALLAGILAPWLQLPAPLLLWAGIGFVAFAVLAATVARARRPARVAVWAVILINIVGTVEAASLLLGGWVAPTLLGVLFVLALALVMGVFAILEYAGLRQSTRPAAVATAAASN